MPSMRLAQKTHAHAAECGFDWPLLEQVFAKVEEELAELKFAISNQSVACQQEEMGDLLFTIVHLASRLNIDPEVALNQATKKFAKRFSKIEQVIQNSEHSLTVEQMEIIWQKNKQKNAVK